MNHYIKVVVHTNAEKISNMYTNSKTRLGTCSLSHTTMTGENKICTEDIFHKHTHKIMNHTPWFTNCRTKKPLIMIPI